jgi:hypothetical protein
MVEPHLEGDKVVDVVFTTLLATLVFDLASSFNFSFFSYLLVFFLQWRLSSIFVTLPTGGWMEGLSSPFLHVQCLK